MNKFLIKLQKIPYSFILVIVILCCYNFIILYSAANLSLYPWCYKQITFFLLFFPVMILISIIDLRVIFSHAYLFYILIIALLLMIEIFGYKAMGAKRWLAIGFIRLQPADLVKIAVVLMLARYFHSVKFGEVGRLKNLWQPVLGVLVPSALVIKQPDLATGAIILFVSAIMFFAAGVEISKFIFLAFGLICASPIIWQFMYDYQKKRILTFFDPYHDPLGASYNIIQSKIAIGSGGFWGKGFGLGTQTKLHFLPEHETDFVFSTLVEELGFFGGAFLCFLYCSLIYMSFAIAVNARSFFAKMLVTGLITIFFLHICINIGMVMGVLPVAGIPLPFMSYGRTMMASMLISFGIIMNVYIHPKTSL